MNGVEWSENMGGCEVHEMMFLSAKTPIHFLQEDAHLLCIILTMQNFLAFSSISVFGSFFFFQQTL